jgi:hypothetical protein
MPMEPGPHVEEMQAAIRADGEAFRLLLAGDWAGGEERLGDAARRYRASWELAPPRSYGRLVGMLKAAVIAGDAAEAAAYARAQVGRAPDSPPSHYVLAMAALVDGDDEAARAAAEGMRGGSPAFVRAAAAIEALVDGDAERYAAAVREIVADFEGRAEHLTGVPIADTALMLERLAEARGIAARPESPLLPPVSSAPA